MPKQIKEKSYLPPSKSPWAEAPYAAVPGTDEDGRMIGDFQIRSLEGARFRDDELGRPHRGIVKVERQPKREQLSLGESRYRRVVKAEAKAAKRKQRVRRVAAVVGSAVALAAGTETVTGGTLPVKIGNGDVPASLDSHTGPNRTLGGDLKSQQAYFRTHGHYRGIPPDNP